MISFITSVIMLAFYQSVKYHNGQRPSKISFLSDTNFLVTAGFNKMREAELILWDTSDFSKPLTRQSLGTYSSGLVFINTS